MQEIAPVQEEEVAIVEDGLNQDKQISEHEESLQKQEANEHITDEKISDEEKADSNAILKSDASTSQRKANSNVSQSGQIYENTEINFKSNEEKSNESLLNDEDILAMQESLGIHAVPPEYQDELNETMSRIQKERETNQSQSIQQVDPTQIIDKEQIENGKVAQVQIQEEKVLNTEQEVDGPFKVSEDEKGDNSNGSHNTSGNQSLYVQNQINDLHMKLISPSEAQS